jgi:hypothetical protein
LTICKGWEIILPSTDEENMMAKEKLTPMQKVAKDNPKLKAYWEEYWGTDFPWDELIGIKFASHGYCVVAYKDRDDESMINMADLSFAGGEWDMQNDGFEPITPADWKKLQIVQDCDWFVIKGNANFPGLS